MGPLEPPLGRSRDDVVLVHAAETGRGLTPNRGRAAILNGVKPTDPQPPPARDSSPVTTNWPAPRAAYIHVPFCAHRCGYCNFTVIAGREDLADRYLEALARELEHVGTSRPVETIFVGGGTPTHLGMPHLARLLQTITRTFALAPGGEFSVEANPSGLAADKLRLLAEHGVTRLSLGAQSFDPAKLRVLERDHSAGDIRRAIELARRELPSVAVDLIFGVPGESLEVWQRDLRELIRRAPDHVSTYGLTYELGTRFWARRRRGDLSSLDEELERALYEAALDLLPAAGYEHYEVSNFAQSGQRCRHNETYWAGNSYWAAGPGAARYVDGRRAVNHQSTTTYLQRVLRGESPVAQEETLAAEDRAREQLVLGLRRLAGVDRREFQARTGFVLDALAGPKLAEHVERGLLADNGKGVRLTRAGLFVSDAIWPDFLRV
ncbi:MAG: radical SAM family heme chaperone HemW [Planctomycetaceae bacterium]|nr:radical SAM family heme chaperone HemW [Planctomycetaceae bacterium]